jgi:hypothetical protein
MEAGSEDRYEFSMDGASSCLSMDPVSSDLLGDGAVSSSLTHGEDVGSSSSGGSSPLGWPLCKRERRSIDPSPSSSNLTNGRDTYTWEHKMEIRETELAGDFTLHCDSLPFPVLFSRCPTIVGIDVYTRAGSGIEELSQILPQHGLYLKVFTTQGIVQNTLNVCALSTN